MGEAVIDPLFDVLANLGGDGLAIDDLGCHDRLKSRAGKAGNDTRKARGRSRAAALAFHVAGQVFGERGGVLRPCKVKALPDLAA